MLARQSTPADVRVWDIEACVLTPSIPAERCVAVMWAAHIAPLVLIVAAGRYIGFLELKT